MNGDDNLLRPETLSLMRQRIQFEDHTQNMWETTKLQAEIRALQGKLEALSQEYSQFKNSSEAQVKLLSAKCYHAESLNGMVRSVQSENDSLRASIQVPVSKDWYAEDLLHKQQEFWRQDVVRRQHISRMLQGYGNFDSELVNFSMPTQHSNASQSLGTPEQAQESAPKPPERTQGAKSPTKELQIVEVKMRI